MQNTNDKTAVQMPDPCKFRVNHWTFSAAQVKEYGDARAEEARREAAAELAETRAAYAAQLQRLSAQRTAGGDAGVLERAAMACERIANHNSDADGKTELVWQCAAAIRALSAQPVAEAAAQAPIGYTSAHDLRKLSHPGNSRSIDVEANPSPDADIPVFAGTVQAAA